MTDWPDKAVGYIHFIQAIRRKTMNDSEILHRITALVDEEHYLMQQSEEEGGLSDEERTRMHELQLQLDQCWDLLRQRRARREFGLNPNEAQVRDPNIVEHYQQ
jgi:hypothetical protein